MKILEGIIKGDEDCINAIYSQMKVKNDNDEDIQYYKKEIQSIKNIVDNYLKEKARADKLEKEYSAMLTESDENECDYKRVLKENEELKEELKEENELNKIIKDTKLSELFYRRNGKKVEQAIKLRDELLKLPECKLYGIKKCKKKVILIIKEEVIPVQKVKDKIKKEIKYHEKNILDIENITMLKDKTAKEEAEIEFNKYAIVVLKKMLQELLEGRK